MSFLVSQEEFETQDKGFSPNPALFHSKKFMTNQH